MSAHYYHVTLPARAIKQRIGGFDLYYDPEEFSCRKIGEIRISFVCGNESLVVWQDLISKQLFYGEFYNVGDRDLELKEESWTYDGIEVPKLFVIDKDKLEQFCHYVMGWKPNVWSYDEKDRLELCGAVRTAIKELEL